MDIEAIRRGAEHPVLALSGDLDAVATDLAAAFSEDVMFDWFLRNDARRDTARLRFFRLVLAIGGAARIERPPAGGAAAVWISSEDVKDTPLITEMRALPILLFATGVRRFNRLSLIRRAMETAHPMTRPHDYLSFLGVTPEAQGHGVGSRLLRTATARLDRVGRAAFLQTQTERNVGLYQRHGFTVVSEIRVRTDSPRLWSLWRDPQSGEP